MNYFISISGLPGSGKSTLANFLNDKTKFIHISSDLIRKEYFGDTSLSELRYKKPLKNAVVKILDLVTENNLLKKKDIIYDSVQSDLSIRNRHINLSNKNNYTFISIELLFSPTTLKKRILNRTQDPYGSEADISVMNRFWEGKLASLGIDSTTNESQSLELIKTDFIKNCTQSISILIYEDENFNPQQVYLGEHIQWIYELLSEYLATFFS